MDQEIDNLRFEEAFARLEAALEEMRQDGLPLDRALELYELGTHLAARCDLLLQQAELRVTELTPTDTSAMLAQGDTTTRVIRESGAVVETEW